MIDDKLHLLLDEFLAADHATNAWLDGAWLHAYVRKGQRWLSMHQPRDLAQWRAEQTDCIDLANVAMQPEYQLQGVFPGFLDHLESKRIAIYVENVHEPSLRWYFARRGYRKMPNICDHCYYWLPDQMPI